MLLDVSPNRHHGGERERFFDTPEVNAWLAPVGSTWVRENNLLDLEYVANKTEISQKYITRMRGR